MTGGAGEASRRNFIHAVPRGVAALEEAVVERARRERDGEPVSVAAEERLDLVELLVARIALETEAGDAVELDVGDARRREADGSRDARHRQPGRGHHRRERLGLGALELGDHVAARFSAQRARPRYDCQSGIALS